MEKLRPVSGLSTVRLGDLVTTPDGSQLTVRARTTLPSAVGTMAGFMVAGELEAVLSTPPEGSATVNLYTPVARLPSGTRARSCYAGAMSYWAPHLPPTRQAMGELLYRVAELLGSVDPMVILWRGVEPVVFFRSESFAAGDVEVTAMRRNAENVALVTRTSAVVVPTGTAPDDVGLYSTASV